MTRALRHTKAGAFAPAQCPFPRYPSHSSRDQYRVTMGKNIAENSGDQVSASRRAFAALLWRAFPSRSEHDLANKAAAVLDVSPRQVKNWLRCENSAAWHYVAAVMAIAGAEIVFRRAE